eukprot:6146783-Lingulodinium_polyedra.AAC.1
MRSLDPLLPVRLQHMWDPGSVSRPQGRHGRPYPARRGPRPLAAARHAGPPLIAGSPGTDFRGQASALARRDRAGRM